MSEADAKRLKALKNINAETKKMYTDALIWLKVPKETIEKSFEGLSSSDLA